MGYVYVLKDRNSGNRYIGATTRKEENQRKEDFINKFLYADKRFYQEKPSKKTNTDKYLKFIFYMHDKYLDFCEIELIKKSLSMRY